MKLDEAGDFVWARAYGGTDDDRAERIAVDANGRIYLTGYFESTADFDPGPCSNSVISAGCTDIFMLRLDSSGDLVWAGGIGGTSADYGRALAVSGDGSVYGSGQFNGTADFDPGPDLFPLETYGHYDIPIFRLDSTGSLVWAEQLGGTNWDQAYDLTVDPDGNLVGVGGFTDVADFGPGATDILLTIAGDLDIVVFRLDSAGGGIRADRFGGPGSDMGYGVHVSPDGSVFATGYFSDTGDFDPGAGVLALTSSGDRDAFLVKLTSNLTPEGLALSNSTALSDSPAGTLVGYFSTTDPNWEDSFTYTLAAGSGDTDNAAFDIVGRKLQTSAAFGGKTSYNIRVRSTDRDGQWFEVTFVVTVAAAVDVPPEVDSVVRADSNPTSASSVDYTVTFTEPVTGVSTDDFVLVTNGVSDAAVTNVAGSGTAYTVTISTGSGDGTLRLDVADDDTILDSASQPLGGTGPGNGRFVPGETYTLDLTPPQVVSVERVGVSPTNASTVDFTLTFSELVNGVDAADFRLETSGLTGVSVTNITNEGPVYTVTVDAGTGDGTLRLDVDDNDSITDPLGNPLGGPGTGNGDYDGGQIYTFKRSPPTVQSIVRAGSSPTDAAVVAFTVTFSESVTGVDTGDFALTTTGLPSLPSAIVTGVTGSGDTWNVIAGTGLGDGTIRLDVADNDSILDAYNNPLGGTGAGNGDYAGGQTYTIDRTGEIHGRKWDDLDGDGYRDPNEPGIAGVTLFLDLNSNSTLDDGEPPAITEADNPDTTGVDETGQYRFEDLGPATYSVTEVSPVGYEQTYPFSRTGATGRLTLSQIVRDDQGGVDGLDEAAGIAVSPDGNHIYVAGYNDNALVVFERDARTGEATFLQMVRDNIGGVDGLYGAQSVVVTPDGKHVYVASFFDDAVAVFERHPIAGTVTFVERQKNWIGGVDGLNGALAVTVSPDGGHVYAVGMEDHAVACFTRDTGTGRLTFEQVLRDGVGDVDGIRTPFSVAVSPNGAHVYVSGQLDDAVAAFARNPSTGLLTFIELEKDGVGGVNGLNQASGVVLSPDGRYVYVAGHDDDRVAVFSRNASDGTLSYVESVYSSTALDGVIAVSLSPDGKHLYTANELSDTVSVYGRNTSTGKLTFVESFTDGTNGIDGLDWAWYTTVSPDGKNVYAVGATDDALVTFSRDAGTLQPRPHIVVLSSAEEAGPCDFGNVNDPPMVTAITRIDASPTNASSVQFAVTFSEVVTEVDVDDFVLAAGAPSGAAVTGTSGSGSNYTVTVDTGSGDGSLRLDLTDNDSILDVGNMPLGGSGANNGNFTGGESYAIDKTPPAVSSIVPADANPTDRHIVHFTVTFSEAVTGVNVADFMPNITGGLGGVSVLAVDGSESVYTVTVDAGTGQGELRLDVADDDSIVDLVDNPLGGAGAGNGDFVANEAYTILPDTAEVRGVQWNDQNRDGVRDAGELGLANWLVYLDLDENGRHDDGEPSTTTDALGNYALTGIESGTYTVALDLPAGWKQTFPKFDPHQIERISVGATGQQADSMSLTHSLSQNAHYVAFSTYATNLVPNDLNGFRDILVRDLQSGATQRINLAPDGSEANGHSWGPVITPDGRFVVFLSDASNLVTGDGNGVTDVFLYDRQTGLIERVNLAHDGAEANGLGARPAISADGRYVAFESTATNLVPNDTNDSYDIFVYDRQTDTIKRVSVASDTSQGDGPSYDASISADGRFVGFMSAATNLVLGDTNEVYDIFVYDRQLDSVERVSVAGDGGEANDRSFAPSLNADGRYVAYHSFADNLVPADFNATADILVYDRQTAKVERISVAYDGAQADDYSGEPSISADGRYIAYASRATNLVPGDTNGQMDVFVMDRQCVHGAAVERCGGRDTGDGRFKLRRDQPRRWTRRLCLVCVTVGLRRHQQPDRRICGGDGAARHAHRLADGRPVGREQGLRQLRVDWTDPRYQME